MRRSRVGLRFGELWIHAGEHAYRHRVAYIFLLLSLLLTLVARYYVDQTIATQTRQEFDEVVEKTNQALYHRIDAYINVMYDTRDLFTIAGTLTASDWDATVARSELKRRYPGMQALGYSALVVEGQQDTFVAQARAEGSSDYALQFEESRSIYFPVRFIEPLDVRNRRLLGYDLHANEASSIVMAEARDLDLPRASAKVSLPSERDSAERPGFVIYLPVYHNNQPVMTVEERRKALQGFIVTIVAADDLVHATFGPYTSSQIDFELFDGVQTTSQNLLHDRDGVLSAPNAASRSLLMRQTTLDIAGRIWTLRFTTSATSGTGYDRLLPNIVLLSGIALSLCLFITTWSMGNSRAEAERIGRERETLIQDLETFSYSVSHDLRAPLRSISGFTVALLEDHGAQFDAQAQDYLNRIHAASRRMDQHFDTLLTFAHLSHQELRRGRVDLSALAQTVADEVQQLQPDRQIEWVLAPGLCARGDARLLRIVLENLFGNAWKFTRQQSTPRIEFGMAVRESQRIFFVRDNGVGFDMAYAGKLFGVFQRLHRTTEFEGTGIGLAIVQRIIRRHGGQIWAEGISGQGATFSFTLAPATARARR